MTYRMRAIGSPLVLLALALAVRLALFAVAFPDPERFLLGDSEGYLELGEAFPEAFAQTDGEIGYLSLARTPVYPAMIAAIDAAGGGTRTIVMVQILLSLVTVYLVQRTGSLFVNERAGLLAALLVAVDPISIQLSLLVLTEVLFVLFMVAAAALVAAGRHERGLRSCLAAGTCLGAAALTRPIALFVPFAFLPVWMRRSGSLRSRFGATLTALVPFVLLVGAWVAWNHHRADAPTFSTIASVNMALYRGAGAIAEDEGIPMQAARLRLHAEAEERGVSSLEPVAAARLYSRVGAEAVADHPVGAAVSAVKGLARTLLGPGVAGFEHLTGRTEAKTPALVWTVVAATIAHLVVLYGAAAAGLLVCWRRWPDLFWLAVPLAAYFLVLSAGAEAYSRFRAPAVPFLALIGGAGLDGLLERRQTARRSEAP